MNGNLLNRVPALLSFVILLTCFGVKSVSAQSITSSSPQTQVNLSPNQIDISSGIRSGGNLFHSFGQFGLNAGQVANFQSNPNIQNILGRVTGGNASIINGTLQVTGGPSNLFLLNPAGIIFGPNAQLNVPAAFTASTANGIGFGNNQWFNAIGSNNYATLSGTPSTAGFLASSGGSLLNAGNLSVAQGQSLTLLGGTVINTGTLTAPGGTITIAAVPGGRSVRLTDSNSLLSIELPLAPNAALNSSTFTPQTLPALLTGGNLASATGLTINNGVVTLTGSSTPISTTGGSLTIAGGLNADVGAVGNGGTIRANAEKTLVTGRLSAEGGSTSGNGGFIETSGKSLTIAPSTTVSTRALQGVRGTWLLDPADLEVVGAGGTGTIAAGTNSIANSTIAAATIVTALDGNNVDLQATNSITVSAAINATPNTSSGNLTLTAPTTNLNQAITLKPGSTLNGTATTVNVGATGTVQNGVDAALAGGTVNLAAATYTLAQEVAINKNITVRGAAANTTTVSGNNASRVFNVRSNITATLDKMTIANGNTTSNPYSNNGAGIYNEGQLTLSNSIISQNTAASSEPLDEPRGGGVFNSGTLNVVDTVISNNTSTASSYGGGIASTGTLSINRSTLSGNSSNRSGGGLISFGPATISNTTISGNTAGIDGGGLVDYSGSSTLTLISNSTISGNTAKQSGGGILTIHPMNIVNSTIVNNTALNNGGGITNKSQINIANSIVAGNISQTDFSLNEIADKDGGVMTSQGHNLVGQNSTRGGFITTTSDILVPGAIAAQIGALANNGGTTLTHAVLPGSLAIDAANPATATTTGQTGNAIAGAARDIGAYEFGGFQFNLRTISGTPQSTVVGTNFQPLVVEVRPNIAGQQVAGGTIVAFTPNSNENGAGIANTAVQSVTIDANNQASITPTANTVAGTHTVVANATGNTGTAQTFNLTNTPDVPATLTATGPSSLPAGQTTVVFTPFANALQVLVKDQYGNVIPGAVVNFAVPTPGASGTLSTVTATTDVNGLASVNVTANTVAGRFNATGTLNALNAQYNLTNLAGAATQVTVSGGGQTAVINTGFTNPLQATVTDTYGNPISGATVNFTVPATGAGGTVAAATATTNANGVATTTVTANGTVGTYAATGVVTGLTNTSYALTNVANPASIPATIAVINNTSNQSTTINTSFTSSLQVLVSNNTGAPLANIPVTFTLPSAIGTSASMLTVFTNGNGIATLPVSALGTAGTFNPIATVNSLTTQFTLTNNPIAVIPVIPVNPVNPVTPSNPVSPSNSGILTSVEQVRIGQDLQRLNPNAKTPAVTSGGSSSLCIVRDREEQNKNTIFDRQGDNQKIAESQKLPDCKPTEKETLITK